mgnify:CR=1 FL=1
MPSTSTAPGTSHVRGAFVTLEGIDGCGKSTQATILAARLQSEGWEVVRLREPGGTVIGEKVRSILLDPANAGMCDRAELLLYEASRVQLVCEVIVPALERGAVVVCDRFHDSTFAYQAGGRGLSEDLVDEANRLGTCGVTPDVTIVLDLDPRVAFARATRGGADRLEAEGLAFQERVRAGYARLARRDPDRVRMVDGAGDVSLVSSRIDACLGEALPWLGGGVVEHG